MWILNEQLCGHPSIKSICESRAGGMGQGMVWNLACRDLLLLAVRAWTTLCFGWFVPVIHKEFLGTGCWMGWLWCLSQFPHSRHRKASVWTLFHAFSVCVMETLEMLLQWSEIQARYKKSEAAKHRATSPTPPLTHTHTHSLTVNSSLGQCLALFTYGLNQILQGLCTRLKYG